MCCADGDSSLFAVFGLGGIHSVWVLGMTGSQVHEKLDVTANIRQEN